MSKERKAAPTCAICGTTEYSWRCACCEYFCDPCLAQHHAEDPKHLLAIKRAFESLIARGLVFVTIDLNGEPRYHVADRRIVL
jgi:hypothetical protein